MKPFDSKGEYTPSEVKAALAGVDGTRQLSFRYERLDSKNKFIESIDYIQSCSIENNALADIKRTAKFDILDTGRMNYLQDRIKPYIRLTMPADETYADSVKVLNPAVWWKLDDTNKVLPSTTINNLADGNTYNSQSTAYSLNPTTGNAYQFNTSVSDATIRDEFWAYVNVTTTDPLMFEVTAGSPLVETTVYFANRSDGALTQVMKRSHTAIGYYTEYFRLPFPQSGYYFIKVTGQPDLNVNMPRVKAGNPVRLEDSSNNKVYATSNNLNLGSAALVNDGGKCASTSSTIFGFDWGVDDINRPLRGGFALNYWVNFASTDPTKSLMIKTNLNTQTASIYSMYWDNGTSSPGSPGGISTYLRGKGADQDGDYFDKGTIDFAKYRNKTHMLTHVIEQGGTSSSFYIDGVLVYSSPYTSVRSAIVASDVLSREYIEGITFSLSGTATSLDDISVYTEPLSRASIAKLYNKGTSSISSARSGYVEWPQGVFVLSSPKRTMVDGNYVHRDVEGYDQLVVLKEDAFSYRYSVPAGIKYTDAVKSVLLSSAYQRKLTLYDDKWSVQGHAQVLSENNVSLPTTYANETSYVISSNRYQLTGFSISARVTTPTTGNTDTSIVVSIWDGDAFSYVELMRDGNNNLYSGTDTLGINTPYNATTQAYWRIREDSGYIYCEVSPDGATWNLLRTIGNTFSKDSEITFEFWAQHSTAATGSAMSEISINVAAVPVSYSITKSSAVLPTALEWDTGTSKLTIINDLLSAINYESATFDEDGVLIAKPYVTPDKRAAEFTYATDSSSVISGDVNQTVDLFKIPNKWVAVVSEADRPPLVSTYTNTNPLSPTSTVARGRTIVDFRTEQKAVDQITLDALTTRLAFEASQVYEVIEFETGIMPIHQNADVYIVSIDGLAVNAKFSEHKWSMDLENGATMKHTVRRVVSL